MKSAETTAFSPDELFQKILFWMDQSECEDLEFDVDGRRCTLIQRGNFVYCVVEMDYSLVENCSMLESLLKIAAPSLLVFSGALCVDPSNRKFCLTKTLQKPFSVDDVMITIEMLSNQNSVWNDIVDQVEGKEKNSVQPRTGWEAYRRAMYV
ncbi:MAG: hypothetical protein P8Y42_03600 [Exilibacterium sp.]